MMNFEAQMKQSLVVYGHDHCPQSLLMAKTLAKYHVDHEWRDVKQGQPRFADELRQLANGYLSVPTVVFPDGLVMVEPWPKQVLKKLGLKPTSWFDKLSQRFRKA